MRTIRNITALAFILVVLTLGPGSDTSAAEQQRYRHLCDEMACGCGANEINCEFLEGENEQDFESDAYLTCRYDVCGYPYHEIAYFEVTVNNPPYLQVATCICNWEGKK